MTFSEVANMFTWSLVAFLCSAGGKNQGPQNVLVEEIMGQLHSVSNATQ